MGFQISPSDRVAVVGKTGSGKSVWIKRLLQAMEEEGKKLPFYFPIIVLDNKGSAKTFSGYGKRIKKLKDLKKELYRQTPLIVYSPIPEERNRKFYDGFFKFLYNLNEPMLVYVDELALVGYGNDVPEHYEYFMKQGRERLQSLWAATQNPVFVNHDFFSNSDHFFIFDLLLEQDRKKMAAFAGKEILDRPDHKHGFWYYNTSDRNPSYFENILDKNGEKGENGTKDQNNFFEEKEEKNTMNGKWVLGIFTLGLVMIFVLPLWKKAFQFLGEKVPATQPIANYTNEA